MLIEFKIKSEEQHRNPAALSLVFLNSDTIQAIECDISGGVNIVTGIGKYCIDENLDTIMERVDKAYNIIRIGQ